MMGLYATGGFNTETMLGEIRQVGDKAVRRGAEVLRKEALEIVKLAAALAPRDDGTLDGSESGNPLQAFKIDEVRDENRRISMKIGLNPRLRDEKGKRVAEYGTYMELFLEPGGFLQLGENSLRKRDEGISENSRAGLTGDVTTVGGQFLQRAFRSRRGIIGKKLKVQAGKK